MVQKYAQTNDVLLSLMGKQTSKQTNNEDEEKSQQ